MLNSRNYAVFSTLGIKPKEVVSIQVNDASATTPPRPLFRSAVANTGTQDASTSVISGEQQGRCIGNTAN